MDMKKILIITIAAASLFGCQKVEFDPNISEYNKNLLVVEGMISDNPDFQYINLSRTSSYLGNQPIVTINNALVSVSCEGSTYIFNHSGNGVYTPPVGFIGEVGKTYHLSVNHEGAIYEADSRMNQPLILDSINMEKDEFEKKKFKINAWFQDNPAEDEFILFKYAINNTLQDSIDQWEVYLDVLSNNLYIEDASIIYGINANIGDSISLYTFSISKQYCDFLLMAEKNMEEPVPFMPPPGARIKGNISNGALGFFQASAVFRKKTKLKI
ncbi:MAG: DUF4249 domain-containing protein [Bacteroidales bacterium]|nr:MAG: DUF4249 domain-containing protein [Bacteroidales bacterium]